MCSSSGSDTPDPMTPKTFLLKEFVQFHYQDNEQESADHLGVPDVREGTTKKWASQKLLDTVLESVTDDTELWVKIQEKFEKDTVDMTITDEPTVSQVPFKFPRTEDDVATAFMSQVAIPIYVIAKMHNWFSGDGKNKLNLQYHEAKVLQWVPEIVGEAFTRSPKEADGSRIAGVRVDKIFVLSASINKDARETRSYTRNVKSYLPNADSGKDLPITSVNKYLPRHAVWDGTSVAKANEEHHDRGEVEVLKGMLPVEFKRYNSLSRDVIRYIANRGFSLGSTTPDQVDEALNDTSDKTNLELRQRMGPKAKKRILGTISMLQQAVRYGNHYAAPRVLLTDYLNAVLIEIVPAKLEDDSESEAARVNPAPTGSGNRKSSTRQNITTTRLRWIFVSGLEVRLLTGIAFWLACVDWSIDLRKAEIEAKRPTTKGKPDEKAAQKDLQRQDDDLTLERNTVM